jgi:hypothetical protein
VKPKRADATTRVTFDASVALVRLLREQTFRFSEGYRRGYDEYVDRGLPPAQRKDIKREVDTAVRLFMSWINTPEQES